ncbi:MAG TPA: hypothetical protein VGG03_13750, partial [Thermoanaerobaculia bacterium]
MKKSSTRLAVIAVSLLAIMAAAAAGLFVARHRTSTPVSAAAVIPRFEALHNALGPALVDMARRRPVSNGDSSPTPTSVHTIHTLVYDTRGGGRIVELTRPFWLARLLSKNGQIRWLGQLTFFDDTEFDSEGVMLSFSDIEHWGPGLEILSRVVYGTASQAAFFLMPSSNTTPRTTSARSVAPLRARQCFCADM